LCNFKGIFDTKITGKDIDSELQNMTHSFGLRLLVTSIKSKQCFLNQQSVDEYLDLYRSCCSEQERDFFPELLLKRFSTDDAAFVDILILVLDLHALLGMPERTGMTDWVRSLQKFAKLLCPVYIFNLFLKTNPADHELVLDWLVSNETRALEFVLKLIKYACRKPSLLSESDNLLCCFSELKSELSSLQVKGMFPYNCSPLLQKIENLQKVYLQSLTTS